MHAQGTYCSYVYFYVVKNKNVQNSLHVDGNYSTTWRNYYFIYNRFQQTTSVNTPPHPGCHYTFKVLILLLQEIKRDIIYRRAQLQEPHRWEELHPRIQAHLISVINKISSLLEYQGTLQFADGLFFLKRLSRFILQAWKFLLISSLFHLS
jgi:hypothetical protein